MAGNRLFAVDFSSLIFFHPNSVLETVFVTETLQETRETCLIICYAILESNGICKPCFADVFGTMSLELYIYTYRIRIPAEKGPQPVVVQHAPFSPATSSGRPRAIREPCSSDWAWKWCAIRTQRIRIPAWMVVSNMAFFAHVYPEMGSIPGKTPIVIGNLVKYPTIEFDKIPCINWIQLELLLNQYWTHIESILNPYYWMI